jgi:hypothetical protein
MNQPNAPSENQGIHYFQAAQRLGISVQHLMHLEHTGVIDPPGSLDRGQGRFYTQAELDAISRSLASELEPREGLGLRTWWLAAAGAVLILGVFVVTRGSPPAPAPRARAVASRPASRPPRPGTAEINLERDDPEGGPTLPEDPEAGFRPGHKKSPDEELSPERRARIEELQERLKESEEKGGHTF